MKTAIATFFALTVATTALAQQPDTGTQTDPVERYKSIFTQLDVDGSQTLTQEESAAAGLAGESFSRLDGNADGSLSLEEFLVLASEAETTGSDTGTDANPNSQP